MRHKNSTLAFVYNNVHNIVQNVVDINTSGVGTVIKSEWRKAKIYMYMYVCVSCEPSNVRRYRGKSFTDLCFCESSKLTRWMRVSFDIQQKQNGMKEKILPCCSMRSLFGSVHEMNATAYQSPAFGPSMLNLFIDPSDLNCKLYISNLVEQKTFSKIRKLISIARKWRTGINGSMAGITVYNG